jgi:hypothetical protein
MWMFSVRAESDSWYIANMLEVRCMLLNNKYKMEVVSSNQVKLKDVWSN